MWQCFSSEKSDRHNQSCLYKGKSENWAVCLKFTKQAEKIASDPIQYIRSVTVLQLGPLCLAMYVRLVVTNSIMLTYMHT